MFHIDELKTSFENLPYAIELCTLSYLNFSCKAKHNL